MVFTVTEEHPTRFGNNVAGLYYTFKGNGRQEKYYVQGSAKYRYRGTLCIYATSDETKPPLEIKEVISDPFDVEQNKPVAVLYAHVKAWAEFNGKTLVDG